MRSTLKLARTLSLSLTLMLASVPGASARQGADDCSMATPIAGEGIFDFDNTGATESGTAGALCSASFGYRPDRIPDDVWFVWTAPADDDYIVSTCGLSPIVDTKIAVYDGDNCALSVMISCNDDGAPTACTNFSSQTGLTGAAAGQTYLIQIGVWAGENLGNPPYTQGAGQFEVSRIVPVINPANGHHYKYVPASVGWPDARVSAEAHSLFGAQGHLATYSDAAEDSWVYNQLTGTQLGQAYFGLYQDMTVPGFSEPQGGWSWVTGEPLTYTNWTSGEPNDAGAAEHWGGYWPADQWNDYRDVDLAVMGYIVEYDTSGSNFCAALPNSTGMPALISTSGSVSLAANNLRLQAGPVESNQPGIFYYGPDQIQVPFGDGFRCIGGTPGSIVRMFPFSVSDAGGVLSFTVDNTLPVHVQFVPGATLNFQAWFRDPSACMSGFNLSDALSLVFVP